MTMYEYKYVIKNRFIDITSEEVELLPWNDIESISLDSCECCWCCLKDRYENFCIIAEENYIRQFGEWEFKDSGAFLERDNAYIPLRDMFTKIIEWLRTHPKPKNKIVCSSIVLKNCGVAYLFTFEGVQSEM